jgi:hypothetical protein
MGWGGLLDQIMSKLPILTPAQRRRLNIEKLEREIKEIQSKPWTPELGALVVNKQLALDKLHKECAATN